MCSRLWNLGPVTRWSAVPCSHNRTYKCFSTEKVQSHHYLCHRNHLCMSKKLQGRAPECIIFISGGIFGGLGRQAGRTISQMHYIIVTLAVCTGSMSLPFSNSTAPLFVLPHPKLQGYCLQKWKQGLILLKTNLEKGNHLFNSRKKYTIKQSWDVELSFRHAGDKSRFSISENSRTRHIPKQFLTSEYIINFLNFFGLKCRRWKRVIHYQINQIPASARKYSTGEGKPFCGKLFFPATKLWYSSIAKHCSALLRN